MPQMYPMMWMNLYIFFLMLLLMFMIKLFYFFDKPIKHNKKMMKLNFLNLKW